MNCWTIWSKIVKVELNDEDYDIRQLTPEELEKVSFDKVKWQCMIKLCKCGSMIKDFGMHPAYLWKGKWINVDRDFLICGKHFRVFKGHIRGGKYVDEDKVPLKRTFDGDLAHMINETGKIKIVR